MDVPSAAFLQAKVPKVKPMCDRKSINSLLIHHLKIHTLVFALYAGAAVNGFLRIECRQVKPICESKAV